MKAKKKLVIEKKVSVVNTNNGSKIVASISNNEKILHYSILVVGALVLYGWTGTFKHGFDDVYIIDSLNNLENTFSGFKGIIYKSFSTEDYRPVLILSFWLERLFFREFTPGTAHLMNVFLFGFLLTRIYSFIVVCQFSTDTKAVKILAFFSCILFLLHPNHVGVVANIKSRDNILSMLFGLLSAIQFIKIFDDRKWWRLPLIILFLVLGFLSKMDCYVFALAPVLVIILFRKANYKKYLLAFILGIVVLIIINDVRNQLFYGIVEHNEIKRTFLEVSRSPLANNDTILNRLSLSFITLLYYLKFLLIPFGYYFYFGYNQIPLLPLFHPINFLAFGIYVALGIGCIYWYKKDRIYLFCFLFFLISIGYAANLIIPVSGIVMDRYNFIPSLGFCIALASLLLSFFGQKDFSIFTNKWILLLLSTYCIFTVYRTSAWKDMMTLVNRDIGHLDKSVHALRIAGSTYISAARAEKKDKELANQYYDKAELFADKAITIYDKSATVWEIKGICKLEDKKYRDALEIFKKCKQIDSNYLSAVNYIGVSYSYLGITDSALLYFNHVMEKENGYGYSAQNILDILIEQKRYDEADSTLILLNKRFPEDKFLQQKTMELNSILNNNKLNMKFR
jgi:hypothetical protein